MLLVAIETTILHQATVIVCRRHEADVEVVTLGATSSAYGFATICNTFKDTVAAQGIRPATLHYTIYA